MIDKYTGREIISPADELENENNLIQKILHLKLTANQTVAVMNALGLGEFETASSESEKDQIPKHPQD